MHFEPINYRLSIIENGAPPPHRSPFEGQLEFSTRRSPRVLVSHSQTGKSNLVHSLKIKSAKDCANREMDTAVRCEDSSELAPKQAPQPTRSWVASEKSLYDNRTLSALTKAVVCYSELPVSRLSGWLHSS